MIITYITASDMAEAKKIANLLVQEKLAACVNIIPSITSIYQWEGKLCESNEIALIVKSKDKHFSRIKELVKQSHSYDCPCIWSAKAGNIDDEFLKWVNSVG